MKVRQMRWGQGLCYAMLISLPAVAQEPFLGAQDTNASPIPGTFENQARGMLMAPGGVPTNGTWGTRQPSAALDGVSAADVREACDSACSTFVTRVNTVAALSRVSENFYILWNLTGVNGEDGAVETQARQTVPPHQNEQPPPSLDDLVEQWALARFGEAGMKALKLAQGPVMGGFEPVFRSGIYQNAPTVDSSCPFGRQGSLGLVSCPACIAGRGPVPPSLYRCLAAYAPSGENVGNSTTSHDGLYYQQLQSRYCEDEALFEKAAEWKNAVGKEVSEKAAGSLAIIGLFESAVEGSEPELNSDGPSAIEVKIQTFWPSYFVAPFQNADDSYGTGFSSCSN